MNIIRRAAQKLRVLLSGRASTRDRQHPEHQLEELEREAERRGWEIADAQIERASGAKADRPILLDYVGRLEARKADALAAVELSRVGRSVRHLVGLADGIRERQQDLIITRQAIDTTTPTGRLVFTVLAAIAQFERELTAERVVEGVAHARRRRGGRWGRPPAMLPGEVRHAAWLRASGASWAEVGRQVDHPLRTIRDALARLAANPTPMGGANPAPIAGGEDPG